MNVFLTPELEKFVRTEVAGGLYNNASEVVRDALRGLIARRQARNHKPPTPPSKDAIQAEIAGMREEIQAMGVTSLGLFGSIARGDQRPGSDIDVMIEYAPDSRFSLLDLATLKIRLEDQLGFSVDVVPRDSLEESFGKEALKAVERIF